MFQFIIAYIVRLASLVRSYVTPIDRPIVYPYTCPCGCNCPPLTRHAWDKDTGELLATLPPLDESASARTSDATLDAWDTFYTLHYDSSDDSTLITPLPYHVAPHDAYASIDSAVASVMFLYGCMDRGEELPLYTYSAPFDRARMGYDNTYTAPLAHMGESIVWDTSYSTLDDSVLLTPRVETSPMHASVMAVSPTLHDALDVITHAYVDVGLAIPPIDRTPAIVARTSSTPQYLLVRDNAGWTMREASRADSVLIAHGHYADRTAYLLDSLDDVTSVINSYVV